MSVSQKVYYLNKKAIKDVPICCACHKIGNTGVDVSDHWLPGWNNTSVLVKQKTRLDDGFRLPGVYVLLFNTNKESLQFRIEKTKGTQL